MPDELLEDVQPRVAEPTGATGEATTPLDTILMVAGGHCVPRALHAVAEVGIADSLGDEPRDIEWLAAETATNADVLGRILRLLSAHGIFDADGTSVRHNDASRLLRSDHLQSARALARMFGLEPFWMSFLDLDHSLRTGEAASRIRYPKGTWEWLAERPEANAIFNEAMIGKAHAQVAGVVEAYDFSRIRTVADIGGGRGHLLKALVDNWPNLNGILFDLPNVVEEAQDIASPRLQLVGGDFFTDELPSADAYVLMEVIHDWADEPASEILSAIARAAPPGAKLLLIEQLMPETNTRSWVQMLDIHMLTLFAAKQRSRAEYERLFEHAGFTPVGATETFAGVTILEAAKA